MKKYGRLLTIFLCAFFVGITPSFAREMTEEELAKEVNEMNPNATYVYIEGEYVFTSSHLFTREDSMLAGRSIVVEDVDGKINTDAIYNEMVIYRYEFEIGNDFKPVVSSFAYAATMTGNKEHPTTYDIKYIDYEYVGLPSEAVISTNVDADKEELKSIYGYDVTKGQTNVTLTNGKLTGFISRDDADGELFSDNPEDRTGFYYPINIKVTGATDKTTITYGKDQKTINSGDVTILYALNPDAENKVIEIYVDLDGDEVEYKSTKYVIDYSELEFQSSVAISTEEKLLDAISKNVEKIVLASDVELTSGLTLTKDIEIDLNGNILTLSSSIVSQNDLTISNGTIIADNHAIIADGGKVTLNDVEITSSGYAVSVENAAELVVNGGSLVSAENSAIALFDDAVVTLNGTELSGKLSGVGANATQPYKKLEVIDSTIKSVGEPAIFFPGSSAENGTTPELVVKNSTLEGISGIDARSGNITISDSTIIALGTDEDWEYVKAHDTASGTTDGAAALYLHSQSPYSNGGTLTVNITNTVLTNKNNTKGVIRVYEHANAGVTSIIVNSDKEYTVENELREEDSKVTLNVNVAE